MILDLVCLTPDVMIEKAVEGLLNNPKRVGIRHVRAKYLRHRNRDPGVFTTGTELLRGFTNDAANAFVVLDAAWDGAPSDGASEMERHILARCRADWADRVVFIAIDHEVEVWAWSPSPHVAKLLGFESKTALEDWLAERGHCEPGNTKPNDPKSAWLAALCRNRIPITSAHMRELANKVSYAKCADPAFRRLLETLRAWFPPAAHSRTT